MDVIGFIGWILQADFAGKSDCCKFAAPTQAGGLKTIYDEKNTISADFRFL
jgi:hypothetical protein